VAQVRSSTAQPLVRAAVAACLFTFLPCCGGGPDRVLSQERRVLSPNVTNITPHPPLKAYYHFNLLCLIPAEPYQVDMSHSVVIRDAHGQTAEPRAVLVSTSGAECSFTQRSTLQGGYLCLLSDDRCDVPGTRFRSVRLWSNHEVAVGEIRWLSSDKL